MSAIVESIPRYPNHIMERVFIKKRISRAYEILGGIPAGRIDLDDFLHTRVAEARCSTIACGGGWLALHPEMQELGLNLCMHGGDRAVVWGPRGTRDFQALNEVFVHHGYIPKGLNYTHMIFAGYQGSSWDNYLLQWFEEKGGKSIAHKGLLMARLKYAFDHFSK